MSEVVFDHVYADRMPTVESLIRRMYLAAHADVIDDPFYSEQRFLERVHGYARAASFELVIATTQSEPLSLALGYGLPKNARWWQGLTTPAEPGLTTEDGTRTFALCELMTHPDWQGQGIAHAVHDELLSKRPERRASLLVRPDNETARQAYLRWGWKQVGKLQPFPDSPHYDVLNLDLPINRDS